MAGAPSIHGTNLALAAFHPIDLPQMVNHHNPAVVAQDYCASTFTARHASLWSQLTSFYSDISKALAYRGWTLLVCLPCHSCPLLSRCIELSGEFLAGSFSLLSITNGASSGGIAPSVGRYGWVAMRAFVGFHPGAECFTDLSHLQVYFTTRIATLSAVILFLVDINVTGRYNCKVHTFQYLLLRRPLKAMIRRLKLFS